MATSRQKEGIYTGDWLTALLIVTQPWLVKSAADEHSCSENQSKDVQACMHIGSLCLQNMRWQFKELHTSFKTEVLLIFAAPGRTEVVYVFTVGTQQVRNVERHRKKIDHNW